MAWTIANNDYLEVTIFCVQGEQVGVNVVHFQVGSIVGTFTAEELADEYSNYVAAAYKAWLSDTANFQGVKLRLVGEEGIMPAPVYSAGGGGVGTGGALMPRQVAGLIRKRREAQGPSGRGRVYAPFPGLEDHDLGALSADGQTRLGAIRAVLFGNPAPIALTPGASGACNFTPVMYTRASNTFSLVIRSEISSQFATQKRRGYFGRPNALPAELA